MLHIFIILGVILSVAALIMKLKKSKAKKFSNLTIALCFYALFGWIFIGHPYGLIFGIILLTICIQAFVFENPNEFGHKAVDYLCYIAFAFLCCQHAFYHFSNLIQSAL